MIGALDARLVERVADDRLVAQNGEIGSSAPVMQMEMLDEDAERLVHGRGVLGEVADDAEGGRRCQLPDHQPEMLAAGFGHAQAEQAPECGEGHRVIGVVEQGRLEPGPADQAAGVRAKCSKHGRKLLGDADANMTTGQHGLGTMAASTFAGRPGWNGRHCLRLAPRPVRCFGHPDRTRRLVVHRHSVRPPW